jgi:hypothetical protein
MALGSCVTLGLQARVLGRVPPPAYHLCPWLLSISLVQLQSRLICVPQLPGLASVGLAGSDLRTIKLHRPLFYLGPLAFEKYSCTCQMLRCGPNARRSTTSKASSCSLHSKVCQPSKSAHSWAWDFHPRLHRPRASPPIPLAAEFS